MLGRLNTAFANQGECVVTFSREKNPKFVGSSLNLWASRHQESWRNEICAQVCAFGVGAWGNNWSCYLPSCIALHLFFLPETWSLSLNLAHWLARLASQWATEFLRLLPSLSAQVTVEGVFVGVLRIWTPVFLFIFLWVSLLWALSPTRLLDYFLFFLVCVWGGERVSRRVCFESGFLWVALAVLEPSLFTRLASHWDWPASVWVLWLKVCATKARLLLDS